MTPEEADRLVDTERYGPDMAAEAARWQARWRHWCAPRGLDPDTAGTAAIALFVATARQADGTPLRGPAATVAVLAVDAIPARRWARPARTDPGVRTQIDAAKRRGAHAGTATGSPPPFTPELALVLMAVPPPPPNAGAYAARVVLRAARRTGVSLPTAAAVLVTTGVLTPTGRHHAVMALARHGAGPGTDMSEDPAGRSVEQTAALWHQLDTGWTRHLRLRAGLLVGWHLAMHPREVPTVPRGAFAFSRGVLTADLPGGTVRARRAQNPRLCAVRAVRLWLAATGPVPDGWPLLCRLGPDGPDPKPLGDAAWQDEVALLAQTAGTPGVALRSLRLGYAATADRQNARTPAIAAGLRIADHGHVAELVSRVRQQTAPPR